MKVKLFLFLILILGLSTSASVSFVNNILNRQSDEYLEEKDKFKSIDIVTKESPLSKLKEPNTKIAFWDDLENKHAGIVKDYAETFAYNKITGFSNGIIDVTYQVRKGVKQAIQETFGGYAEYQRRKQVEEIANTTFQNRKKLGDLFLNNNNEELNFKNPFRNFFSIWDAFQEKTYSYQLIRKISNNRTIKDIRQMVKMISLAILSLLIVLKIFSALRNDFSLQESFTKPVMVLILSIFTIVTGDMFLSININLLNKLARAFMLIMNNFQAQQLLSPSETWTSFAGSFGYFPTLILSIFDMVSQVFIGFFYITLISYIVFGLIFYPVWVITSIFNPVKFIALGAYLNWLKANLALVFSPILIIIFRIISKELSHDYMFMSILAKTLSFYSTPLLMGFIFFKINPTFSSDYEKIDYSSQLKEEIKDLLKIKNA
jgi:hypothetical protein